MKFLSALVLGTIATSVSGFTPASPLNMPTARRAHSQVTQLNMVAAEPKVVLVTGASRGLGAAIAKEIGSLGHSVIVNYAGRKAAAEEVVAEIEKAGGKAIAVQADCKFLEWITFHLIDFQQLILWGVTLGSSQEEIQALIKKGVEEFGGIDVLINNAGVTEDGPVLSMKKAKWDRVIDTNLSGVFFLSQEFFKLNSKKKMKEGAGRIINISSIVGQIGNKGQA